MYGILNNKTLIKSAPSFTRAHFASTPRTYQAGNVSVTSASLVMRIITVVDQEIQGIDFHLFLSIGAQVKRHYGGPEGNKI